jgi:hypothetical protein
MTMHGVMRRFTRLTNALSKYVESLPHAMSLHFMYYDSAGIHKTPRVTSPVEAGISQHIWTLEEIVRLLGKG